MDSVNQPRVILYWRASLILPFVGALVGATFDGAALLLASAMVIAGIPYAIFALAMWFVLGSVRTVRGIVALVIVTPLLFLAIAFAFGSIFALLHIVWRSWRDMAGDFLGLIPFFLGIGSIYVLIALGLFCVLWSRRFFELKGQGQVSL